LLKFSTGDEYFNAGRAGVDRAAFSPGGHVQEKQAFAVLNVTEQFGDCVAYKTSDARLGQINRGGNKMAKKTLKKAKKIEATKPLIQVGGNLR
jgi:hypothetical protein